MEVLSKLRQLYAPADDDTLGDFERQLAPSKAAISEHGWAFLVNDANNFLRVQFGLLAWSPDESLAAARTLRLRVEELSRLGAIYRKFIIPEKSVIYRQYLPNALRTLQPASERPAQILQRNEPATVKYLADCIDDARSYGLLYFRGDTHTNWLGAWFVYRFIIAALADDGVALAGAALDMAHLSPTLASYDGDLFAQLNPDLRRNFLDVWGLTTSAYGFETTISLALEPARRQAEKVEVPQAYRDWFKSRESFVFERVDGAGLRAVIFRDSTLDFNMDWLAQHFSRSVFIWHEGQVYAEVIERERPDIVLHIMAERFVTRYNLFPPFGAL